MFNKLTLILSLLSFPYFIHANEFFGDPQGVGSFHNSRVGKVVYGRSGDLGVILKDQSEVENYMACYLGNSAKGRMREFQSIYKPFLEHGVQNYQIPPALGNCVLFRETKLDNSAVSPSGVRSIIQMTGDTYKTVKNSLNLANNESKNKDYKEFLAMQKEPGFNLAKSKKDNFFIRCHQFKQGKGHHVDLVSISERSKGQNICIQQLRSYDIAKQLAAETKSYLWNASRSMDDTTYKRYFSTPRSKGWPEGSDLLPPSSFDKLQNNPMWLMAIKLYYLKYMLLILDDKFNEKGFDNSERDYIGYLAILAGSYNLGPGILENIVRKPGGSISSWCREMIQRAPTPAKAKEVSNYILSLKRCMVKGSNYNLTGNGKDKSCGADPATIANITDPCSTLRAPNQPTRRPKQRPSNATN